MHALAFLATSLLASTALAAEYFIPANDPRFLYAGRTVVNADGSRSFDWEGTSIQISVKGTTYLKASFSISQSHFRTKFICDEPSSTLAGGDSNGFVLSEFWVDSVSCALANGTHYVAAGLDAATAYTVRLYHDLEPNFHGDASQGYGATGFVTFHGMYVDSVGAVNPAPAVTRRIEWVGDSITAGFGSRGAKPPCQPNQYTTSAYHSYSRMVCDELNATCSDISWSGKGMLFNCCDTGEAMPAYFLQTLGIGNHTRDWNFKTFIPDALAINLGTNDFSKNNGTQQWLTAFENEYVSFVVNATQIYYGVPKMPVLLVQGPFTNTGLSSALQSIFATLTGRGVNAHHIVAVPSGMPDGCQGHPGAVMHPAMAALLVPQIKTIMNWS